MDEEDHEDVVVIASGQSDGRLGLTGEAELFGRGISHCASCDGPLYANKTICVVGDGEWAADEALHLAEYAAQVILVVPAAGLRCGRRRRDRLNAAETIEVILDATPTALTAHDGILESIDVHAGDGRRTIPVDGLFPIIGWRPNTDFVPAAVARHPDGTLAVDRFGATTVPNLFAAGDVTRPGAGTLLEAAAAGVTTGSAVNRLLASA
jgi:thioredoxin reductase (NADPH)